MIQALLHCVFLEVSHI